MVRMQLDGCAAAGGCDEQQNRTAITTSALPPVNKGFLHKEQTHSLFGKPDSRVVGAESGRCIGLSILVATLSRGDWSRRLLIVRPARSWELRLVGGVYP
jgi:hypothetical protein